MTGTEYVEEVISRFDSDASLAGAKIHLEIAPRPGLPDITDDEPSRKSIDGVKPAVVKALADIEDSAWVRPNLHVNRDVEHVPERAVEASLLVEKLVSLGYHCNVVRWAVYDCIECGELAFGFFDQRTVHMRAGSSARAHSTTGRNKAKRCKVAGAPAMLQRLYVWPTERLQRSHEEGGDVLPDMAAERREGDAATRPPVTGPQQPATIPPESWSRFLTKKEAARLHAGEPVRNPTAYFKRLVAKGLITPPIGSGQQWQFNVLEFPESVRDEMLRHRPHEI